jgi:tetratricopeptide (TPR) repeat protein
MRRQVGIRLALRRLVVCCEVGLGVLLLGALLAGCATAYARGSDAFRAGRYGDAAREFETAAESGVRPLDALTGLGIARYKAHDLSGAQAALQRVLARDPRRAEARLYLALVELEQHEDARALEQLETLRPLIRHPRIAAAVDRAIAATREGCSETSRRLIAASLDDAVEWARDVREANERASAYALEPYWTIYRDRYYEPLP